jgi:hypothetical protein
LVDAQIEVIHTSLCESYPELSNDELRKVVDSANLREIGEAVMALNKLRQGVQAPAA